MIERLDLAKEKGCDGVEPDNVDGFTNETGFDLSDEDQLAFNMFIANAAHLRALSVGLKNDGGQAETLVDFYDFSLNEQCHEHNECDELKIFTDKDRPIFNAEYEDSESSAIERGESICDSALANDIRTLILPLELDDSFRVSCD